MALTQTFEPLALADLKPTTSGLKADGWRFVQVLCANTDNGIDMVYSFERDGHLRNLEIKGVAQGTVVPSITDDFLAAFVFENEAHDLFGVEIEGIAIDFKGHFYALSQQTPMTVISPAQKAAREKAAKIAAAKAAKEQQIAGGGKPAAKEADDLEAKLAGMDPEKAAKVRAAMEAKAKKQAEAAFEEKLAGMDPEKAAKVRAAMEAKAKREAAAGKDGE